MTQTFYVQAQAATDTIRTASFGGGEYLVVPVIALVEGVLHSANAENPELALAEEFGRFPNAWDGRPIVMNHPQVSDDYVSANSPGVLEDWAFGQLFNTRLVDNKLKTEAWINLARVAELGGEVATTVERIQAGEVVEVSTGLFAMVEENSGEYENIPYTGIWRSIAPDHLAFLSEGTIGACSVADGCGVPRLNMMRQASPKAHGCGCGCDGAGTCGDSPMTDTTETRLQKDSEALQAIIANSYPADMPIDNVQMLLKDALESALQENRDGVYNIYTYTQDIVVYETWNSSAKFQRSYTITDNSVTLGDDVVEVNLMTSIVPKMNSEADVSDAEVEEPQANSSEGEKPMSNENNAVDTSDTAPQVEAGETTDDIQTSEPRKELEVNTQPAQTVEEYIAAAPADMRDMLSAGLKLHNDRRAKLIDGIKANEANKFSEAALEAMDTDTLEHIHAIASVPKSADYSGQAGGPRTNAGQAATDDQMTVPTILEAFPRKTA